MGENDKIVKKIIRDTAKGVLEELKGTVVKEVAKELVNELKTNNMIKKELSFYKRVELLLYNYENLKEAVKQKDEDIKYLNKYGLDENSKSIVIYSSTSITSKEDRQVQLKEKYIREKGEILRNIKRIDNALNKIREDKYFKIIQLKYLNLEEEKIKTDEELAEIFNRDRKTILRNRKRLINKLTTILFPESLREVM